MNKRSSMWTMVAAATLTAGLFAAVPRAHAATDMEKCQAAKLKAGSKKVRDTAKCHEKVFNPGQPLDDECLLKALEKFTRAMAKADTIGWCPGATSGMEAAVQTCVGDLLGHVYGWQTTTTSTTTTTTLPSCTGKSVAGFCWYLGDPGADCNATCAAQGKVYDPATASYAGSGGIGANCAAVVAAFGWGFDSSYSGLGGVGCATLLAIPPVNFRDTDPTTASATYAGVRRFCACQ